MNGSRKYTGIELAEILQVPRTTVNEWLVRFPQYIDFQVQGKRKVYTDASIEVLKEISELKGKGLSSFEIEEELAKKHPIRGEEIPKDGDKGIKAKDGHQAPEDAQAHGEQLIIRNSMNEMGCMIKDALLQMNRRIDELEKSNERAADRASRWYLFSLAMFVVLVLSGIFAAVKLDRAAKEKLALSAEKQRIASDLDLKNIRIKDNEEDIFKLEKNLEILKKGMDEQKKEFEKTLEDMRNNADKAKEAEILRERDKFAGERLEMMKKLEEVSKSRDQFNVLVLQLQQQSYEQSIAIKNLSEKAAAQTPAPVSAPVPEPQPAPQPHTQPQDQHPPQ